MDWNLIWTILGSMFCLFSVFTGLMIFMMSRMENRLHGDINGLSVRLDATISRMDANFAAINARLDVNLSAANARLDVMNSRLDANQMTIIRMLEKSSKTG